MDFDKILQSGASQLAGSLGSMAVQGLQGAIFGDGAKRDFERNKQLMDYQFKLNKEAALSQKDIQMAQGLNPLLGQGGQMNSVSVGSGSNETTQQSQRQANAIAQQQANQQEQLKDSQLALQDAERRKARAEELNIAEDTAHKTLENLAFRERYDLEIQGTKLRNKFQELQNANTEEEKKRIQAQINAITQSIINDTERVGIDKKNSETAAGELAVKKMKAPSEIADNYASANEKNTAAEVNSAEAKIRSIDAKWRNEMNREQYRQTKKLVQLYANKIKSEKWNRRKILHDMFINNVPRSVQMAVEEALNMDAQFGRVAKGLMGLQGFSQLYKGTLESTVNQMKTNPSAIDYEPSIYY